MKVKFKFKPLLIIIGVILLAALLITLWPKSNRLPWSSLNAGAEGTKALKLLLEKRGVNTALWEDDYTNLPGETGSTLMIIHPWTEPPAKEVKEKILEWVRKGNQLILWTPPDSAWASEFGLEGDTCQSDLVFMPVTKQADNPWFREIRQLRWPDRQCITNTDHEVLLGNHSEEILVSMKREGNGQLVFVPEPYIVSNQGLDQADNLAVPLGLVESFGNTVYFDETVHAAFAKPPQSRPAAPSFEPDPSGDEASGVKYPPIVWLIVFQLLLLTGLWLYARGKRFGAPRWEQARKKREGQSQVDAMAFWLMRVGGSAELLRRQQKRLEKEVRAALRIPDSLPEQRLVEEMRARLGEHFCASWNEICGTISGLKGKSVSEGLLVRLYNEMNVLRKELATWKPRSNNFPASKR
ncbi:DUF4350 domain-containing protein [Staphylospora marina]|uniref:DUF4350 domain-containing protein n=1 Tax=Staphylospora marina TaxID=2490858 RepID=UPI0013DE28E4|nr:DUF4350 domain-containing protein [Staphylospora marina]